MKKSPGSGWKPPQAQLDDVAGHQRGDVDCGLPPVAQDRCVVRMPVCSASAVF